MRGWSRPTATPPCVGEWLGAPGAPTVLVYGHYDVQPTGDLAEWITPPFELAVDGDTVRGRGATDDKGPVYIVLKTAQAFLAQEGGLPLNVRFLFEGEEEIGSPHLPEFVRAHADELRRRPRDLGRRRHVAAQRAVGLARVQGPVWRWTSRSPGANRDLHSGRYGGTVANPLHALAQILATLHTPDGTDRRRRVLRRHPRARTPSAAARSPRCRSTRTSTSPTSGWPRRTASRVCTLERLWTRPTLEVNGITGGG